MVSKNKNMSRIFIAKHAQKKKKYLKRLEEIEFQNSIPDEFLLPFTSCREVLGEKQVWLTNERDSAFFQ